MNRSHILALGSSLALGAALLVGGCHSETTPAASAAPVTTPPTATPSAAPPVVPAAEGKPPVPAKVDKPAAASMTHVLTQDEPFYDSMPGADSKALGELKKGSKVLLMVPGTDYSQVLDDDGATVYVPTYGLEPIPTKK